MQKVEVRTLYGIEIRYSNKVEYFDFNADGLSAQIVTTSHYPTMTEDLIKAATCAAKVKKILQDMEITFGDYEVSLVEWTRYRTSKVINQD